MDGSASLLQLLAHCRAVAAADSPADLCTAAARGLEGFDHAESVALVLADVRGVPRVRAWHGAPVAAWDTLVPLITWPPAPAAESPAPSGLTREGAPGWLLPLWHLDRAVGALLYRRASETQRSAKEITQIRILAAGAAGVAARLESAAEGSRLSRREEADRRFLHESGALLASSLDLEPTLRRVAELAVPGFADWCVVCLLAADGVNRVVAVAHDDPAEIAVLEEILRRFTPPAGYGTAEVIRTGEPELIREMTPDGIRASLRDPEHAGLLIRLGLSCSLTVALRARGEALGTLTFAQSASGRRFGPSDVLVAQRLADHAGCAVESARTLRSSELLGRRLRGALDTLAAERERLAVTLRSIGEGVVAGDPDGRVTLLNRVGESITGWTATEAVGRSLEEVLRLLDDVGQAVPLADLLQTREPSLRSRRRGLLSRDGRRTMVEESTSSLRDADGAPLGVVVVFRDVMRQHKVEEELARSSRLESVGMLAGVIAHDLNNILTSIVANVSLARHVLRPEHPAQERLDAAEKACGRAQGLSGRLLTFARGGAPSKAPVEVGRLLRDAAAFALRGTASSADIRVDSGVAALLGDATQLAQVLHNLLINADQAMGGGGVVAVAAQSVAIGSGEAVPLPAGRYVRIAVTDAGPGIPAANIGSVFDPFFTTKPGATGLGLAAAYSIVRRHEGHITVEAAPGGGASFLVYLPEGVPEGVTDRPVSPAPTRYGRGRILVMDDDAAIRRATCMCLVTLGYEADAAVDGAQALAQWESAREEGRAYVLGIFDLTVPGGMGGREAMALLRAVDPEARAIVCSGYSDDPVMARPGDYGFRGMLRKPFTRDEIGRTVAAVLGAE